jgi:hydrogenase expression/formation protein HypC
MCLGVPGQIVEVIPNELGIPSGRVSFGGVVREVCLAYTPEAVAGDWVVVHVGFAITRIDEEEAQKVFATLRELGELEGLDVVQDGAGGREVG